jgi:hypothetical protein
LISKISIRQEASPIFGTNSALLSMPPSLQVVLPVLRAHSPQHKTSLSANQRTLRLLLWELADSAGSKRHPHFVIVCSPFYSFPLPLSPFASSSSLSPVVRFSETGLYRVWSNKHAQIIVSFYEKYQHFRLLPTLPFPDCPSDALFVSI